MTLLDLDRDPVVLVPGFSFAAMAAGIKKNGKPDLALIAAEQPVSTAAVYTRNLVRAAPVLVAEERTKRGTLRAILINAGNANACTGAPGMKNARATTRAVSDALGCPVAEVAPASTGVIGAQLPVEKMLAAIPSLASSLRADGAFDVARAIMTTDQWPKVARAQVALGRKRATVLGVAKGAGMIHPDMATTLGFVITDVGASPALLRTILKRAVEQTFNSISVDGDTSTNDTIVLMASGRAGGVRANTKEAKRFEAALTEVLGDLGESIVRDGEGAQHVARIEVVGARSDADARRAAKTIATSPLVKTAMHGKDPNWGRILAAAGRSGARFDPAQAELTIEGHPVLKRGLPLGPEAEKPAAQAMRAPNYTLRLRIGRGPGAAHYLTCDLGSAYVSVNADYRS